MPRLDSPKIKKQGFNHTQYKGAHEKRFVEREWRHFDKGGTSGEAAFNRPGNERAFGESADAERQGFT